MGIGEIFIIIGCVGIVSGVIIKSIIDKKHGKCSSCDCCNGNCSHCAYRNREKKYEKK